MRPQVRPVMSMSAADTRMSAVTNKTTKAAVITGTTAAAIKQRHFRSGVDDGRETQGSKVKSDTAPVDFRCRYTLSDSTQTALAS